MVEEGARPQGQGNAVNRKDCRKKRARKHFDAEIRALNAIALRFKNSFARSSIDIFVPDPQFLGYVNPRLGGRGEEVTSNYKDGAEFVKLFLPEGEIDFVASPTLTQNPFEEHEVLGNNILLETPVEIVAKKLWCRGDRATPRDLLDLALVIEHHYSKMLDHGDVFAKNIEAFTEQCGSRRATMLPAFDEIERIECKLGFDECLERANSLKADLLRKSMGQ